MWKGAVGECTKQPELATCGLNPRITWQSYSFQWGSVCPKECLLVLSISLRESIAAKLIMSYHDHDLYSASRRTAHWQAGRQAGAALLWAELTNFQTNKFTNLAKTSLTNTFHNHVQSGTTKTKRGRDGQKRWRRRRRQSNWQASEQNVCRVRCSFARCQFNKFAIFALKFVTKPNETSPNSSKRVEVVAAATVCSTCSYPSNRKSDSTELDLGWAGNRLYNTI